MRVLTRSWLSPPLRPPEDEEEEDEPPLLESSKGMMVLLVKQVHLQKEVGAGRKRGLEGEKSGGLVFSWGGEGRTCCQGEGEEGEDEEEVLPSRRGHLRDMSGRLLAGASRNV